MSIPWGRGKSNVASMATSRAPTRDRWAICSRKNCTMACQGGKESVDMGLPVGCTKSVPEPSWHFRPIICFINTSAYYSLDGSSIDENTIELIRTVSQRSFPHEQPATYGSQPVSESKWMLLFSERFLNRTNARRIDSPSRFLNVP